MKLLQAKGSVLKERFIKKKIDYQAVADYINKNEGTTFLGQTIRMAHRRQIEVSKLLYNKIVSLIGGYRK